MSCVEFFFFFFQAEDGIRDYKVTGVQTCALPIYLESLRGAIHGRGEARWPCAYDHQIAHLCLVYRLVEAETVGDLAIRRITQDGFAAADHHRCLSDRDMKVIEKAFNIGVALQIYIRIWVAVPSQKLLDSKRVGGMA